MSRAETRQLLWFAPLLAILTGVAFHSAFSLTEVVVLDASIGAMYLLGYVDGRAHRQS